MKADRKALVSELVKLKPALNTGSVVAELSCVWFDGEFAYAYNGGFGIKLPLETNFSCGVPGTTILGLLGSSALSEVTLEHLDNSALQIKLGKSVSKLGALDLEKRIWPYPSPTSTLTDEFLLTTDLVEALRKALLIKASPPTRVEHHGILLEVLGGGLGVYSTDSATMIRIFVQGSGTGASFGRVILPRAFAEQIVTHYSEGMQLSIFNDCLGAHSGSIELWSNLLDLSSADDLGDIVAKVCGAHVADSVDVPAGFEETLVRAGILSGAEEAFVELSVRDDVLKVKGSYSLGQLEEDFAISLEQPQTSMRVRAGAILRGLAYAKDISVTKSSLLLSGEGGFVYIAAAS